MRNLSQDELRQLEQAKHNEIRQYQRNEVMEALKGNEEIRDELVGLRRIVTVKHFPERRKVKARLVILDYQAGDLDDESLESGNANTNTSCQALCPACGSTSRFELKEADVSGASLQRREKQADRYVVPVNELADALGITRGEIARLRKAGYGSMIAPQEWVESVCDGMKEMGLVQCKTDPCVWKLVKDTSQGPQLQVLVLFHTDHLGWTQGEAGWEEFQWRTHSKSQWSEWGQ